MYDMPDDTRTRIAGLEARFDEGIKSVRERIDTRHVDSLQRFDRHTADDLRQFTKIEAGMKELGEKLDKLSHSQTGLVAKIGGVVFATLTLFSAGAWVFEHLIGR